MRKIYWITAILLLLSSTLTAQQSGDRVNLNQYYRYPFSGGAQYQQLSGMANDALADFSINEISGAIRMPIPTIPALQVLLRGGVINYGFTGNLAETHQDWSHRQIFIGPGVGYTSRISREFEVGIDLAGAYAYSIFSDLILDGVSTERGQQNLLARATGRLALNPSYNVSLAVNPMVNYSKSLGPMNDYDGFSFGVGFGATYRFGQDPDRAAESIRAIRFDKIDLPPLFAAMQSYYVNNPAGTLTISNKERYTIDEVTVSFIQPGFMDSPTPIAQGMVLKSGESIQVPMTFSFNNEIFSTQGITPLSGEVIVSYSVRGREIEQRQSVTYDLYDRNALTWDDDRKAVAFITPQDSAVRNYASYIRQINRDIVKPQFSTNLQFAMQAFIALGELGILYQSDPTAPFTQMQGDTLAVDSISLPRETLKRLTGDCDDLTVLYSTLLEAIGIDTALITIPGHIFCAFDTGVDSADYALVNPDRSMTLAIDGSIWVPVEITRIGRSTFTEAWIKAQSEMKEWDENPELLGFYKTSAAQQIYRPVALRESDLGLQYGDERAITTAFRTELAQLSSSILGAKKQEAERKNTARDWNSYGITAAKMQELPTAESAFTKAVRMENNYLSAQLNLGSLYFLQNKYSQALEVFSSMAAQKEKLELNENVMFKLYLNISKSHYGLSNRDEADNYYQMAMNINPEKASSFAYLGLGDGTIQRASDEGEDIPIQFWE